MAGSLMVSPEPQAGGPWGGIGTLASKGLNSSCSSKALQVCLAILTPDFVLSAAFWGSTVCA